MPAKHTKQKQRQQQSVKPTPKVLQKSEVLEIPKWVPLGILVLAALIYSKALFNGITYFDDYYYILTNPYLHDFTLQGVTAIFTSFYSGNYHPLTTLTYLVEYNIFKENPLPYHLINVVLHLINTWLVFILAEQLSGKKITACVVCLLFAIHPMHVESVAWISERKDVLHALFYLLSLIFYIRYISTGFQIKNYFIVLLFFILSLLSKSAAVTLPVLLFAIDIYKGRKITGKVVIEKMPLLLLSLLFGVLAIRSQSAGNAIISLSQSFGYVNRLFLFTTSLSAYLINLILPFNLAALHYYPTLSGDGLPWYYYLSLPFIGLVAWFVVKKKFGEFRKEVFFGIFFFLIAISVMLQVISVGTALYSERYTYISYIGLFYIMGQLISGFVNSKFKNQITWFFSIFIIVFCLQTWQRIGVWKDSITLFTDIIEKNPGNANASFAYNIRGNVKKTENNFKEAIQDYNTALQLYPDLESAYFNRGHAYDETGNYKDAITDFTQSIKLNPKFPDTYNDRGWVYWEVGDARSAIEDFNRSLSLDGKFAPAYNNRGWVYFKTNDIKGALNDFDSAIKANPDFLKPWYNSGIVKALTGDIAGAIEAYSKLIRSHPRENMAYYNRGYAYYSQKDFSSACRDWKKADEMGNEQAKDMLLKYCR